MVGGAGRRPGGGAAETGGARLPAAGRRAACGPDGWLLPVFRGRVGENPGGKREGRRRVRVVGVRAAGPAAEPPTPGRRAASGPDILGLKGAAGDGKPPIG